MSPGVRAARRPGRRVRLAQALSAALLFGLVGASRAASNEDRMQCDGALDGASAKVAHDALAKRLQPVIDACTRLIADQSRDADLEEGFGNRALAYHRLGEFRKAVEDDSAALKAQAPNDTAAVSRILQNRAAAYLQLRDWDHAIADFAAALDRDPKTPAADNILVGLGAAYFGKGDHPGRSRALAGR